MSQLVIRVVQKQDYPAIKKLVLESFGAIQEVVTEDKIVESLRLEASYRADFELVAVLDGQIVGHGMLSDVTIGDHDKLCALAPLAVDVNHQGQGIGRKILEALEKQAKKANYRAISVLGDPAYYQRFGYREAKDYGISCPFEVPSPYFMIKELTPGALSKIHGQVMYLDSLV